MASDDEYDCEYEDEWEDSKDDSFMGKASPVSVPSGQVHPLTELASADTKPEHGDAGLEAEEKRDALVASLPTGGCEQVGEESDRNAHAVVGAIDLEKAAPPALVEPLKAKVPTSQLEVSEPEMQDECPSSKGGQGDFELPVESEVLYSMGLVSIHARRDRKPTPPPCPVIVSRTSDATHGMKSADSIDLGAQRARVAAKRVSEFRQRQAREEAQERALESAAQRRRREARRANDAMHAALGVAGTTTQEYLKLAWQRQREETRAKERAATLERKNRWYTTIPRRSCSAPAHASDLQQREMRAKQERQRASRQIRESTATKQARLREKARLIVAKSSGGQYVRGSYLLKETSHKPISCTPQLDQDQRYLEGSS